VVRSFSPPRHEDTKKDTKFFIYFLLRELGALCAFVVRFVSPPRHEDTKDLYFLFLDILRAFVVKSYLKGELESQNNASDAISNKRNIEIDKETQSFLC